jgi:hypothetical protein
MRFWMRLLSSGSVTSVQSSVLVLDRDEDECFFELDEGWCFEDWEGILGGPRFRIPIRVDSPFFAKLVFVVERGGPMERAAY